MISSKNNDKSSLFILIIIGIVTIVAVIGIISSNKNIFSNKINIDKSNDALAGKAHNSITTKENLDISSARRIYYSNCIESNFNENEFNNILNNYKFSPKEIISDETKLKDFLYSQIDKYIIIADSCRQELGFTSSYRNSAINNINNIIIKDDFIISNSANVKQVLNIDDEPDQTWIGPTLGKLTVWILSGIIDGGSGPCPGNDFCYSHGCSDPSCSNLCPDC